MNLPQSTSLPISSQPRKAHKGLLRVDLLVLRHIFSLNHGLHALDQDYLKILGLNLPDSDMKDLLIVSLDVKNPNISQIAKNGHFQIGISVLDTRRLQSSIRKRRGQNAQDLLQTHQFCIGSPKYFKNSSRSFCFGQSKHINLEDLSTTIQDLISN